MLQTSAGPGSLQMRVDGRREVRQGLKELPVLLDLPGRVWGHPWLSPANTDSQNIYTDLILKALPGVFSEGAL